MLTKSKITLTAEKFQEIYTNEEFRNQVAYAHGYASKTGHLIHKQTCSYPVTYIVTDEQINLAKIELERAKKQVIEDNKGVLVFVGMGMTYDERYHDDVCNHRVRTEFKNSSGRRFFIEFGRGTDQKLRIDHAIDRDLEDKCNIEKTNAQPYNNYGKLERDTPNLMYTKSNLLKVVNQYFDCNFSKIMIDNYNLRTDDITCKSPAL